MQKMPRKIASAIDHVARQTVGKDWPIYAALLDRWQEIVGQAYAEVTAPVKIAFPHQPNEARRQNGILTIRLPKGLTMEFSFKSETIRQKINAYFGYQAIARIALEPGQLPARATPKAAPICSDEGKNRVQSSLTGMEETDLRAALQSFGEAVHAGNERAVKAVKPTQSRKA